jgi:hypothetical protein
LWISFSVADIVDLLLFVKVFLWGVGVGHPCLPVTSRSRSNIDLEGHVLKSDAIAEPLGQMLDHHTGLTLRAIKGRGGAARFSATWPRQLPAAGSRASRGTAGTRGALHGVRHLVMSRLVVARW